MDEIAKVTNEVSNSLNNPPFSRNGSLKQLILPLNNKATDNTTTRLTRRRLSFSAASAISNECYSSPKKPSDFAKASHPDSNQYGEATQCGLQANFNPSTLNCSTPKVSTVLPPISQRRNRPKTNPGFHARPRTLKVIECNSSPPVQSMTANSHEQLKSTTQMMDPPEAQPIANNQQNPWKIRNQFRNKRYRKQKRKGQDQANLQQQQQLQQQ